MIDVRYVDLPPYLKKRIGHLLFEYFEKTGGRIVELDLMHEWSAEGRAENWPEDHLRPQRAWKAAVVVVAADGSQRNATLLLMLRSEEIVLALFDPRTQQQAA